MCSENVKNLIILYPPYGIMKNVRINSYKIEQDYIHVS